MMRATPYVVARRIAAGVIGATLVALGAALLVLPGPGVLVMMAGLGVLALEFAWARRWLRQLEHGAAHAWTKARRGSPDA